MQAIGSCYFIVYYTKTLAISFIALLQRNDRLTRVRVPIYLCAYIWSDSLSEIDFKNCRLKPFSIYDFLENRIIMRACGRVGARVRGSMRLFMAGSVYLRTWNDFSSDAHFETWQSQVSESL
jgi:hypothetical protein